jgi:hypothetical protein
VLASYHGLIDTLVVDVTDNADEGEVDGVGIVALETRITNPADAAKLARAILSL